MKRQIAAISFGALAAAACGDTSTSPIDQLNLDRPSDVAFSCYGGLRITDGSPTATTDQPVTQTAQPTSACEFRSGDKIDGMVPVPPGQEDLTAQGGVPVGGTSWIGLILQSGPGTVALARWDTKPSTQFQGGDVGVLDADPLTPGKNSISIGEDPVGIIVDRTGCKAVTANAGSCDLSVLDVGSAVDEDIGTAISVSRMDVKNSAGAPLRSKPAAIFAEPSIDVIGKVCPMTPTGLAYIAYPSCHIVAAVDLATGSVVGGIQYDAAGTPSIMPDGNVICPDECTGATVMAGTRPVAIDMLDDKRVHTRRMAIGSDNSSSITIVELDATTSLPLSLSQVAFEVEDSTKPFGFTSIAVTPQIGMGGFATPTPTVNDMGPGGQSQFVYGVATDHTVRVADILNLNKECDAQVDPRYTRSIRSVKQLACMPVGDPTTPPRRPGAHSPGIELIGDGTPTSVAVFKATDFLGDLRGGDASSTLIGYFGVITATNGAAFIFNIDDDAYRDLWESTRPLLVQMPRAMAHQLRDSIDGRDVVAVDQSTGPTAGMPLCDTAGPIDPTGSGQTVGGPRATTEPVRSVPLGVFAPEKVTELPGIRTLECVGEDEPNGKQISETDFVAPEALRDIEFPDLRGTKPEETWTMTWQGNVSIDTSTSAIDGPPIRESQIVVDGNGMRIVDQTRPFCKTGVEQFDIVQLRGCDPANGDFDCPLGYTCFTHPNSQVQGIGQCMLADEADRLADACKDFLLSQRRFTVGFTKSGAIQLMPRRSVLRTTPVEGCTSNDQCAALSNYAATTGSSLHPVDETGGDTTHTYTCEADPLLPSIQTGKRCELRCDTNTDCLAGTVCEGGNGSGKAGFCMESVMPPQACLNAPQRYEIHVHDAFAVAGTLSGFDSQKIADNAGNCIDPPKTSGNRLLTARIPLTPPACNPAADAYSGQIPDAMCLAGETPPCFEPNPCSFTVENTDIAPNYVPGTCTLQPTPTSLVKRQAPAIKFRNRAMTVTIVDPYYPGDAMCILDRQGTLGNIPNVFQNYQISFRQTAGFQPLLMPVAPAMPVKVLRGPLDSVWVIDQGDFLSTSISLPSTRGKVFDVQATSALNPNLVNTLE